MKEIKVLGPGCPKCETLLAGVKEVAAQLELECRIDKVTDIQEIVAHGVMMTPALVIDGEVKTVGKVPSKDEIIALLK